MQQRIAIVGGGFGGLAAACLLSKAGHHVTIFEKNTQLGGRAGLLKAQGFRFDTGPSWLLMRGVFEHFFALLGERLEDHVHITKLSPSYRVFDDASGQQIDITSDLATDAATFDAVEPGAGAQLRRYLAQARLVDDAATASFLYTNYEHIRELIVPRLAKADFLGSMHRYASRFFANPLLQKIVEYPSMFVGTTPYKAPALYGVLNHYLLREGVLYPQGGMYSLVEALVRIGKKHGALYQTNAPVSRIRTSGGRAIGVVVGGKYYTADLVISDAGIYHTETALLDEAERERTSTYWQRRTWSPSALLLYIGVNRRYTALAHHNLLFAKAWRQNFAEISGGEAFSADPSLYVCAPSRTDASVAPPGCENLFVLVPVGAGLRYTNQQLHAFTQKVLDILEEKMDLTDLRKHIIHQKTRCVADFEDLFNSYQGSSLGLAHTLRQSAIMRPGNASKKIGGLLYVGADVRPGIGLPSVLISAELAYKRIVDDHSLGPLAVM